MEPSVILHPAVADEPAAAEEDKPSSPDVEALRCRLEEQADDMNRLNDVIASKAVEYAKLVADRDELVKQNQLLYKELSEVKRNYELVSDLYDAKVA